MNKRNLPICIALIMLSSFLEIHAQDTTPPATPINVKAISYELHVDLTWQPNNESDLAGYKIYKWNGSAYQFLKNVKKYRSFFWEWIGSTSVTNKYKISAYDNSLNESGMSSEITTVTHQMSDEEYLDMTQRATFRYFWDWADPTSGIARERWQPNESDVTNTIGGGGFGVMAILVGVERGFITREEGVARIKKIVDFLSNKIDKFHGAFPHWFNGSTGKVVKFGTQDGGDIVESSFMIQGLIAAKQYFNLPNNDETQIRNSIKQLWENVDWDFYRNGTTALNWNWSPTMGFKIDGSTFLFHGWNETLITYLLAVASPTHPVFPNIYKSGWADNGNIKYTGVQRYGYDLYVGNRNGYGGPLFFTHYSFLGFDPRGKRDLYANYFMQNYNQTMINRAYCIENPKKFAGYTEDCWGLTASNSIPGVGYLAHEPGLNDNGTIAPTAAISSMPYFLYEKTNYALNTIKHFYRVYGNALWGDFGFKDAFNVSKFWFNDDYLAIDQGPIICMIENYRSQLLWNLFMKDEDIKTALTKIPFFPSQDPSDATDKDYIPAEFKLNQNYPNPFNPTTKIEYQIPKSGHVLLKVYDLLGKEVATLVDEFKQAGKYHSQFSIQKLYGDWAQSQLSSGVYFYRIVSGNYSSVGKMIMQK